MFGIGTAEILAFIFILGIVLLIISAICYGGKNNPTWTGIIVSALLNLLILYLVLCFFGIMGEERTKNYG